VLDPIEDRTLHLQRVDEAIAPDLAPEPIRFASGGSRLQDVNNEGEDGRQVLRSGLSQHIVLRSCVPCMMRNSGSGFDLVDNFLNSVGGDQVEHAVATPPAAGQGHETPLLEAAQRPGRTCP
jgi:hypothetical protein